MAGYGILSFGGMLMIFLTYLFIRKKDRKIVMTRKVLMLEQFRDDPAMLAFAYTTPISALIHLCDREPEKTEGAIAQIEAFSRHFIAAYGVK
jgi:hypothetical protein